MINSVVVVAASTVLFSSMVIVALLRKYGTVGRLSKNKHWLKAKVFFSMAYAGRAFGCSAHRQQLGFFCARYAADTIFGAVTLEVSWKAISQRSSEAIKMVRIESEDQSVFGKRTILGQHGLENAQVFSDANLAKLIDKAPKEYLFAHTMGDDCCQRESWSDLIIPEHLTGTELLEIVKRGKIWINLINIHKFDEECATVLDDLYSQLARQVPSFAPLFRKGTLLISSANAQVFYHADASPNLLWHIRGEKKVFVYPADDPHFISYEDLEKIFTREAHEEVDYDPSFDASATSYTLKPGQFISWPQNSPHRVENLGSFNVSLNTEFNTKESQRKEQIYSWHRFLRSRGWLVGEPSVAQQGVTALLKATALRVTRKLGLWQPVFKTMAYSGTVCGEAAEGFRLDSTSHQHKKTA